MIKKFNLFEGSLLKFESKEVIELVDIIEDSLIDLDVYVSPNIHQDRDDDLIFTTSVSFQLELERILPKLSEGNPYSVNPIDIHGCIVRYKEASDSYVNTYTKFVRAIQSLIYRLEKCKYKMSSIMINGNAVNIHFVVIDEKIVRE